MTYAPGPDHHDERDSSDRPAPRRLSLPLLLGAAAVAAVLAVMLTTLALGDDEAVDAGATPAAPTSSAGASQTPTQTPSPSASDESISETPAPAASQTPERTAAAEPAGRRGIDPADPLAPWRDSAPDADGAADWTVPVFRAALTPNPTGAAPSGGSGRDLRLYADPQRVRSDGSPEQLLARALTLAVKPPKEREAYNGLPYGAPYESLFADGVSLSSVSLSADGSTALIDLAAGPGGTLLAPTDDEVGAQATAYEQLAWTVAAVLGDDGVGVVVSLDGRTRPLPGTDEGAPTDPAPEYLAPVQLLAPAEGSRQSGEVRFVGLVSAQAPDPFVYLAGSGEDIFVSAQVERRAAEPLGTGLRLVSATLSLEGSLIPADLDAGLRSGDVGDSRLVRAVAP